MTQIELDEQVERLKDALRPTNPRKSPQRWLIPVLAALAAVLVLIFGIRSRVRAETTLRAVTDQMAVPSVSVVAPKHTAPATEIILPGNMQPFISSPIYARTDGYLKKWYFDIGAHVRAGELLAVIQTPEVDEQLAQARSTLNTAQANLELAQITRDRYQSLLKKHAVVNLSMHAALAIDYFAARSLDAEEKLLQDTVAQYQQAFQLNEDRYEGGLASEVEVEQARTILETTRAQMVDVGVARAQYEHAAAVLVGKPPADFTLPPLPLTTPPPPIPVDVPSTLLERRPDIAAAERRVTSANAQVGLAKTAYYPLVNILGSGGFESGSITTLLQGPSGFWAVGSSALVTLFDVGRRRAVSDQAKASYDSSVASYRETVLTGFQQVEDNLAALRILEQEAGVQATAVDAAQRSLSLSNTCYEGGVTSYLEVITAQNAALADEVTAVNILGRRMANAVLLIEALGGGWDSAGLPQRPECCGKLASNSN
jgi:multidrug efflux pump subunit AcrA (membrane-fusion protein)